MSDLVTVRQLHDLLGKILAEDPSIGEYLVATSKDPEGNGYYLFNHDDDRRRQGFGVGVIDSHYGGGDELTARPVFVIVPGYPAFELADEEGK